MGVPDFNRRCRLAVLVAAMLGPAALPAAAQTAIKFSLDNRSEGPVAFFLVPQDKGYFRSEKLEVTVDEGNAAIEPITRVASGAYDMGFADINTLIRYRSQNPSAPVKAIFMVYNTPPYAVIGRKSRGIGDPKSLENKRVGAPSTGSTYGQWPLFAKLNHIDISKVTLETIAVPVRVPMLAAGQLDAVLGYSFRVYIDLKDRGVQPDDIVMMLMATHELKLYGSAIIVNTKFAAEKPEAVRGFLRAVTKGLRDTVRQPAAAVDSVLRREEVAKKDVELERLRMALKDNIVTPEVRANGFGAIDTARLEESINQIGLVSTYKNRPKAEDIFDSAFLPTAAERKVP
jgi:NitT/TauT family transport system substrate-binding protein